MSKRYKLPSLGENVEKAQVIGVLVAPGDRIEKDQSVIEVETDKASLEVPSPASGRVSELLVKEGDEILVGKDFIAIEAGDDEDDEDGGDAQAADPGEEESDEDEADVDDSDEDDSNQDDSNKDDSNKDRGAKPSAAAKGSPKKPARRKASAGAAEKPSAPARAEQPAAASRESSPASRESSPASGEPSRVGFAAPSVRRFAREIGEDIDKVKGSGPGGRITIADVKEHARANRTVAGGAAAQTRQHGMEFVPREEPFERRPLSNVRRTIAERMTVAWTTIPHVTLTARADVTEVEEVRQRYKAKAQASGGNVTITAILLKVAASALKVFPEVNSSLQAQDGELHVKRAVNLGVAVDTERGLLVPVVRDADRKNIIEISAELSDLSERARSGKLKPDDMKGASFTITNLGGMGIAEFTPIINPPEVAVLGVGRAELVPQLDEDGDLVARHKLPLSLSIDHRVLDGADGARFLQWIVRALEDPLVLALEG